MFKTKIAAIAIAGVAVLSSGVALAGTANATTNPTYVASIGSEAFTTSATGTGASAVVNAGDTFSLTVGIPASSTSPSYAQADLAIPSGSVLPTTSPLFTSDNYGSGSPRWVIQLGNGDELMNDYSGTGTDTASASASDWSVNLGKGWSNTLETYSAAVNTVGGPGQVVSNAYIVADTDQVPGTVDTISDVSYNGVSMTVAEVTPNTASLPELSNGHVSFVNNNDAQVSWTDGAGVQYVITRTFGYDMTSPNGEPHPGFTGITTGYWGGLAAGHSYQIELIPANANRQPLPNAQVGWIEVATTDVK